MRQPKVCLDAGHGGMDPGALRPPFTEKELTLSIVRELQLVFDDHDTPTVLTRKYDVFVSLSERVRIANMQKCDVFVSVHLNADPDFDGPTDPEARGFEVWHHRGSNQGKILAEVLHQKIRSCLPQSRGVRNTDRFYVLKHTKMPAVLVECGFVDSIHDATLLSDPQVQRDLALVMVEGLLEWWSALQPESILLPPASHG